MKGIKPKKMDGYSYNNIFETKGIEYLIIIAFLVIIIPFWIVLNRRSGITNLIRKLFAGILSPGGNAIQHGMFYSRNHTWANLSESGNAKIGLDDFLLQITGEVRFTNLKKRGDFMSKGELMEVVTQKGKTLKITSPLSGKILNSNTLISDSYILNEDPHLKGWIYEVLPTDWSEETGSYFFARKAVDWSKREFARFKDFMAESARKYAPENSMVILQDGGELYNHSLAELPDEVWQDFQKSFLN
jgi:glycine cleavage system H protein